MNTPKGVKMQRSCGTEIAVGDRREPTVGFTVNGEPWRGVTILQLWCEAPPGPILLFELSVGSLRSPTAISVPQLRCIFTAPRWIEAKLSLIAKTLN